MCFLIIIPFSEEGFTVLSELSMSLRVETDQILLCILGDSGEFSLLYFL